MSYRLLMHPLVSKAEMQIFKALSDADLTRGMITQYKISLREDLQTVPDALWIYKRKALYIDGAEVHKWRRIDRDDEITGLMEAKDWSVLRVRCTNPLRHLRLLEIVEEVRKWLKE